MKALVPCLTFGLLCVLTASGAPGVEYSSCPSGNFVVIQNLEILGNTKTSTEVISRELGIHPNDRICETRIQDSIDRLKQTGLFAKVTYSMTPLEAPGSVSLKMNVTEKWTTIPIFKVNSGGGVSQYTLGIYDPNIFGEFLEAGTQYENLSGASSLVLWFKNPRLWGQRQGIDLQYWNTKRIRIKYDQAAENAEITRGFLLEREKLFSEYFREISRDLILRISLDYNRDVFSTKILPKAVIEKLGTNPVLPPSTELVLAKAGFEWGRISGDPHSLKGQVFAGYLGYAHSFDKNADPFTQGEINFTLFKPVTSDWQFGQRILLSTTTTKSLQYWQYLGGLDRIRGFADNRFAGRHFVLSNSEVRYLILEKPSALVQGVGFADLAAIGDQTADLFTLKAASVGTGLRMILPKFYRFILRLDYAQPLVKKDTMNWSFGVQQFF